MKNKYDIIVVGGGHAGCEAALAASRMGASTLLVTFSRDKIGYTSCNPSIGGVGKGQLVKEIDALGGEMGKAADASCIQFRMLNSSKGYAAKSSRMQIDRARYNRYMRECLSGQAGLDIFEGEVTSLIVRDGCCEGFRTSLGEEFSGECVILTPGTFMNGTIHIGLEHFSGGRLDEKASMSLADDLARLGFLTGTLKTGTPARLDAGTIDFSSLDRQNGDELIVPFSFSDNIIELPQRPCYITRTNENTHRIIREALDRSPLYTGKIKSTGVRYCPSIEDKVVRFPDRTSHVVFLEPEGLDDEVIYPNGISTSLPVDVQTEIVHSIKGLENAKILKPAYGIEYVFVDPVQLYPTLETKSVKGLFMAGQINGTTGYEEAAALGLMAGINAARKVREEEPIILERSRSYIGVLIDDLVTKGTKEPYRMFTSRVEYRILVREDNADIRLSDIGLRIGLVKKERVEHISEKLDRVEKEKKRLASIKVSPGGDADKILAEKAEAVLSGKITMLELLKRPGITYDDIERLQMPQRKLSYYEKVLLEVDIKYSGYIERETAKIKKFSDLEKIHIPGDFLYKDIPGLSNEVREKLTMVKPRSLAQASRVSGVTPAAISILMIKLRSKYGR